ncbi:anti sigma b factor antagonist RsbV [Bacillus sp. TS-2]|nr:anti sigma b factor antagonist RsbV [Bacillus sp. TS-2]
MNLEIRLEQDKNEALVYLDGEIDAFTAPKLRDSLFPLVETKDTEVVVNLSGVNYIDSTGLGVFVGAFKATHSHESKLQLTAVNERVYRLFSITGLDEVIDIVPEEKEGAK